MARFGYRELFYGVIYQEEIWMEATTAREIIKRAKADDIYDGPMPGDDETAVTEAQDIVKQAEEAWQKHIRGPEVEAILKIAAGSENGGDPEEAEPEAEVSESENEERVDLPSLQDGETRLQKVEPWENYADDTVKNITEGLNYFAEEDDSSILEILRHVWQFETAHKNRARILTHVSEMYEKFGGTVESSEAEPETGAEEEESDAGGDESEDVSTVQGISDESEGDASVSSGEGRDDEESDAEPVAEREDRAANGEGKSGKAKSGQEGDGDGTEKGPSAYAKLVKGVEDRLRQERLDVPKPPEEKAPDLPWNWGEISDSQLHELHMRYGVCAYYKAYRLTLHERIAQHCREAADELHNARMISISKYDEKGKEKKVGLIEAEIASDPQVKRWRVLQRKHEQLAAADKREMDGYYKVVESLSRFETMRHNAYLRGTGRT